jgi:atypical dual specificity phosphatase
MNMNPNPCGFYWLEEGRLAGSAYPGECLSWLRDEKGIQVLLSLEPLEAEDNVQAMMFGFTVKTIAIPDFTAGNPVQRADALAVIDEYLEKNQSILVHCKGGLGRTGMILALYLVTRKGIAPDTAISKIRTLSPGAIEENTGQKEAIYRAAELNSPS